MAAHLFDPQKAVRFVKAGTSLISSIGEPRGELDGEEIAAFYENLVASSSAETNEESKAPTANAEKPKTTPKQTKKMRKVAQSAAGTSTRTAAPPHEEPISERDLRLFFKAAATNDVDLLEGYLKRGLTPDIVDQFGWTPLMCAAAEGSTEAARLLLLNGADLEVEAAGMNAEKLAEKNRKREVLELFREFREAQASAPADDKTAPSSANRVFCPICDQTTTDPNHETSIPHLVARNSKSELGYSYGIQWSNTGYRLLKKGGWMEGAGLGSEAQGRKYPIRSVLKQDRKGLGLEKGVKKITHFAPMDPNAVAYVKRRKGSFIREVKKKVESDQQRLMRIRRLLSSD